MIYYSITKQEPIAIYGGGKRGISIASRLLQEGYNVCAIIDVNPNGIKNSPVAVMTAQEFIITFGDTFVYISLMNAVNHIEVARWLKEMGFKHLLFTPLFLSSQAAKAMIKAYNDFFDGSFSVKIPMFEMLWKVNKDDFILYENDAGFIVTVVHKDYIYSRNRGESDSLYGVLNINNDFIPVDTFDKPIMDKSIEDFTCKQRKFSDYLSDFLGNAIFNPNDFFIDCAAPAIFNKKGYFNLMDGHHRSIFLVNKGFIGIPIRINKHDWALYFKENEAQILMDYCYNFSTLPMAIKHPAFIRFPVSNYEPSEKFLELYSALLSYENGGFNESNY